MRTVTLGKALAGITLKRNLSRNLEQKTVRGLEYDSRRVEQGFLFFAFPGAKTDGRRFAQAALDRGAVAVVSDQPAPSDFASEWLEVEHGRNALALAARNFYAQPDERVALTAVTGTECTT